ncbi:MAG: dUTP diphosphatase [Oscillospiraceae bacterium]
MELLKIKKLTPDAVVPTRATQGSAGYDLYANIPSPVTIKPNEVIKIPTGIAIAIESPAYVGLVYARSGLSSKHLIAPINCVGVIDSDYRGELMIPLINHGNSDYIFNPNDRIAQLVISPVFTPQLLVVDELDDTNRGTGGFGSTGPA